MTALALEPVAGLPEVREGDDLAALIAERVELAADDVLVCAHKVVSKAEGRVARLADVEPSARAVEIGEAHGKDPRHVEVILRESAEVIRERPGVLICRTHHGFICANAGVDLSNTARDGEAVLLPVDPDASARALRAALPSRPAVVISDSFGRAWRVGQVDVAIGVAGLQVLDDWRGGTDARGAALQATLLATADAAAAAAELVRVKDAGTPAVVVRGLGRFVTEDDGPGARALLRARAEDLFA